MSKPRRIARRQRQSANDAYIKIWDAYAHSQRAELEAYAEQYDQEQRRMREQAERAAQAHPSAAREDAEQL